MAVVLEGWIDNTMALLPIPLGHICGELDSRLSMNRELILFDSMSRAPGAPRELIFIRRRTKVMDHHLLAALPYCRQYLIGG